MSTAYTPLQDTDSIRLLHLIPSDGTNGDPLVAELSEYRLDRHCSYEAISYAWGEADTSESFLVGGHALRISKNLSTILKQIRYTDQIRTIWVDAVCINQEDVKEKNHQVVQMGKIYKEATTVLCWLGPLTTHRLWAMRFIRDLARDVPRFIKDKEIENFWAVLPDWSWNNMSNTLAQPTLEDADDAHVESIYSCEYFSRLWIIQELSLATSPVLLCGTEELSWKEFELASRILCMCLAVTTSDTATRRSLGNVWNMLQVRAKYMVNSRPFDAKPTLVRHDVDWNVGQIALDIQDRGCKDQRDKVYAILSLTTNTMSTMLSGPEPEIIPDYTRSVEWAYYQFWRIHGGYTSLFWAGLSRRQPRVRTSRNPAIASEPMSKRFLRDDYLPSWAPDLRSYASKRWKPIFSSDYVAMLPHHHMKATLKPPQISPLVLRGHRFDKVVRGWHISKQIEPCMRIEDFADLRRTANFWLNQKERYEPYPTDEDWVEALGSALITGMPQEGSYHPFQSYSDGLGPPVKLDDDQLKRIWKLYITHILADDGSVWTKFMAFLDQHKTKKKLIFDPDVELTTDEHLAWLLHKFIGDVMRSHRLIVTSRGYMGLAPPDTEIGDIVGAIGGPGVPFILRDTDIVANAELKAVNRPLPESSGATLVADGQERVACEIVGPCYIHGIMNGELFKEQRYKEELEWETDQWGSIPTSTIYLV